MDGLAESTRSAVVLEDEVADALRIVREAGYMQEPQTGSKLERTGSKMTKWATRALVIILTVILLLVIIAYWQWTNDKIDHQFNSLFSMLSAASLL